MSADSPDDPRATAIHRLEQFGLSTYAARTFVALSTLGVGTARDVSRIAEVPRTRVYDAAEELRERGLVETTASDPRRFRALSPETTVRTLQEESRHRIASLRESLEPLEPTEPRVEQRGVWTVDGGHAVVERVRTLVENADDEVVYMCVEQLLTDESLAALRDAADRGVTVRIAGLSPAAEEQVLDRIPEAEPFDSMWAWSDGPAGRVMLADRTTALTSVRVGEDDDRTETAVWARGETNSLVVVLRAMLAWRLDDVAWD